MQNVLTSDIGSCSLPPSKKRPKTPGSATAADGQFAKPQWTLRHDHAVKDIWLTDDTWKMEDKEPLHSMVKEDERELMRSYWELFCHGIVPPQRT